MLIRLRAMWEGFRGSLFFVPFLFLLLAALLAEGMIVLDTELRERGVELPALLSSTVDSARALLGTIAAATITVAGIAFSVSLLLIQLASSQFSPRVLREFFRDSFTKRILGLVVGTFVFCLLVLRAVRGSVGEAGQAVIPNLSVFVALVLGIVSILGIVAFINHSAHSMEAAEIIRRITGETREMIERLWPASEDRAEEEQEPPSHEYPAPSDEGDALVVTARAGGWVQQVDPGKLLDAASDGGTIRLEIHPGDFVVEGRPICTIWPQPEDEHRAIKEAREAIRIGRGRTMQQDVDYGIRQLVDIALRALSPGINDPTTAQEVIVHLGAVLRVLLLRDPPQTFWRDGRDRRLYMPHEPGHADLVDLAFDQIRRAGAAQPSIAVAQLESLGMLRGSLVEADLTDRLPPIRREARLVLEEAERAGVRPEDLERVRGAALASRLIEE